MSPTNALSPEVRERLGVLAEMRDKQKHLRLVNYKPHPKQLEFHEMGLIKRLRLLSAGNQYGKSEAGAVEISYHTTGLYPEDWKGVRLTKNTDWWVGGETAEALRDIVQEKLLGPIDDMGTGWIPKDCIVGHKLKRSIADAVDYVKIKHVNGGISRIYFKSYEQGRKKWQGKPISGGIWLDEEPPQDIWEEAIARTTATEAMLYMTFTPLQGPTAVVRSFWPSPDSDEKGFVIMGLKDALHIPESRHEAVKNQYPIHQRRARVEGLPVLGEGHVFPIDPETISCDPFDMPNHFAHILGLDFGRGGTHPTAWIKLSIDRDADVMYVTDCYTGTSPIIPVHASAMKRHPGLPVAWPPDGSAMSGQGHSTYVDLYRREGIKMLMDHATMPDGSVSVEAGVAEMFARMVSGRLKVFSHLTDVFNEIAGYYRKDGKIVKEADDRLCAIRYAVMMSRFASYGSQARRRGARYAQTWDPLNRRPDGSYKSERPTRH